MQLDLAEPQQIFVDHLRKNNDALGFIGLGIGKTAAILTHLSELFLSGDAVAALIIAPLRVINLTWPNEIRQWEPLRWIKFANLRTEHGQRCFLNGSCHIYGINFESIPLLVSLAERRKNVLPYDVCVIDELTKSKNPSSKRINLFRRKVPRVKRNIGITGTPLPNSSLDLFAQVRLIDGGQRLGTNFTEFKKTYFFAPSYMFAPWKPKADTAKLLEEKISDITCTLKSSDWLNLPDTVFEDVDIEFPKDLQEKYRTLEKELILELRKDKMMNVGSAAALVTKLLQFTSGHVYDENREVHPIHDLKFAALKKIAKEEEQPLLVATIFQHEQTRIREQFPHAKFFSDAKTPNEQQKLLASWNKGEIKMLVAHPASAGHGINLQHGSSVMVWLTLTYSRELYEQMIGRLSRRGQERVVKVYRLMISNTVDWAVAEALQAKASNEARLISALQMLENFRNGGNGK